MKYFTVSEPEIADYHVEVENGLANAVVTWNQVSTYDKRVGRFFTQMKNNSKPLIADRPETDRV